MRGLTLIYSSDGQLQVLLVPQALRHLRGERAGRDLITLLSLLAHSRLEDGDPLSHVTPEQVAEETGLPPAEVNCALQRLGQDGLIGPAIDPGGAPCHRIHL